MAPTCRQGKFAHILCLAHTQNMVVQWILVRHPGFQDVLLQTQECVSTLDCHILQVFLLPKCSSKTSYLTATWSAIHPYSLGMLHQQQQSINILIPSMEWGQALGNLGSLHHISGSWFKAHSCSIFSPFEEASRMVSCDEERISDTASLVVFPAGTNV